MFLLNLLASSIPYKPEKSSRQEAQNKDNARNAEGPLLKLFP
jgi:hypothetical protein